MRWGSVIRPRPDLIFFPSPENPLTVIVAYANECTQIDLMAMGLFKSWCAEVSTKQRHHRVLATLCYCCVSVAAQPVRTETLSSVWGASEFTYCRKAWKAGGWGSAFYLFVSSYTKCFKEIASAMIREQGLLVYVEKKKINLDALFPYAIRLSFHFSLWVFLPQKDWIKWQFCRLIYLLFSGSHPPVHIKHLLTPHLHTVAHLLVSKAVARANGGIIIIHWGTCADWE